MTVKTQPRYHPRNERVKRDYLRHQKEACGKADSTVDALRKAIGRFENYNQFKDFGTFNKEVAVGFKRNLLATKSVQGTALSKSTVLHTLNAVKDFFRWLGMQPGYKSRIVYSDIDWLTLSDKEVRAAKVTQPRQWPSLEQVRRAIEAMPHTTEVERRDRALMAFALLTGMRDSAIATIRIKHVDLDRKQVWQDPKEVKTKASKAIMTAFFPVGDDMFSIVQDWIRLLREEKLFGPDDPVFPQTNVIQDRSHTFVVAGVRKAFWSNTTPIRQIFKTAFERVGLPYFNPHSIRKTLVALGQNLCQTPEQFKAWSQNLGHEDVLTTFTSYGQISMERQTALIHDMKTSNESNDEENQVAEIVRQVMAAKKRQ